MLNIYITQIKKQGMQNMDQGGLKYFNTWTRFKISNKHTISN